MPLHRAWLCLAGIFVLITGCRDKPGPASTTISTEQSPEEVYRRFFLELLEPREPEIRGLILDHPDAEVLWVGGPYPPAVAALLAQQYREMEIERLTAPNDEATEKVILGSSAIPLPTAVVKERGAWKVDAGRLIELRKSQASKQ